MEELHDVVLHVYQLAVPEQGGQQQQQSAGSFFARMLPNIGMGAYHTSLQVDKYRYTFAANAGIVRTLSEREGVPPGATYQEAIPLGASCIGNSRGQLNDIVKKLGDKFFTKTGYHLVYRNCNHFTETLATALILYNDLLDKKRAKGLSKYPAWINRLANTSQMLVPHDADIVPCKVWDEARIAIGADEKVGWGLSSNKTSSTKQNSSSSSSSKRKPLTEAQKAALAKIKGGNK